MIFPVWEWEKRPANKRRKRQIYKGTCQSDWGGPEENADHKKVRRRIESAGVKKISNSVWVHPPTRRITRQNVSRSDHLTSLNKKQHIRTVAPDYSHWTHENRTSASRFARRMAATTVSVRPNRLSTCSPFPRPPVYLLGSSPHTLKPDRAEPWWCVRWRAPARTGPSVQASSRADDSTPFEMSVENALKLLGVSEAASFEEILRAKNSVMAACKDDQEAIAQVIWMLVTARGLWSYRPILSTRLIF